MYSLRVIWLSPLRQLFLEAGVDSGSYADPGEEKVSNPLARAGIGPRSEDVAQRKLFPARDFVAIG